VEFCSTLPATSTAQPHTAVIRSVRSVPAVERIFELVASGDTYKYKVLWRFNGTNGAAPYSSPILDSAGDLYGVTSTGGANNLGTMYEVTP
jgi:uncharacterized repeat protein (TIGR03803 family)